MKQIKFAESSVFKTFQKTDSIEELHLPNSLEILLKSAKIDTVGKFYKSKRRKLSKIRGIGKKTSWFLMVEKRKIKLDIHKPERVEFKNTEQQIGLFEGFDFPDDISPDDPIDILKFPTRTENTLKTNDIKTIKEFNEFPIEKFLKFRNIGPKSVSFFELAKKYVSLRLKNQNNANSLTPDNSNGENIKEAVIPNELLVDMLIERSGDDRSKDVIRKRFGLNNGERQTLEEIGNNYGITRERVRQIQVRAVRRMQHPSNVSRKSIILQVTNMLHENGIMISDLEADTLVRDLFNNSKFDGSSFLDLLADIGWIQRCKISDTSFYTIKETRLPFSQLISDVYTLLKSSSKLLTVGELESLLILSNNRYLEWDILKVFIERICKLDPRIEEKAPNQFTLYGLHSRTDGWASLIREVLVKEDMPLHFTEISNKVNDILSNFENRHLDVRRVHSILIEKNEFCHSGVRGTYGLKVWGFRKETTAELIEECINKAGFALHWKQIYNYVSKYKDTKPNNITAILNSSNKFLREGRGMYGIANEKQN